MKVHTIKVFEIPTASKPIHGSANRLDQKGTSLSDSPARTITSGRKYGDRCESDSKIRTNLIHDVFGYHVTNQRRFSNITRFEAALFSLDFGEV